jgi:hypothetical protein
MINMPARLALEDRKRGTACATTKVDISKATLAAIPGEWLPLFQEMGEPKMGVKATGLENPKRFAIDNPEWDKIVIKGWKQLKENPTPRALALDPAIDGAYVDCLPLDAKSMLLVLLWDHKFQAWRAEWKNLDDEKKAYVEWSDKPVLEIATDLQEPFVLYGKPSRLFFVTRSGALHLCLNADKGGGKTELVWTGDPRPIRVVISDVASGKDFAFAPAKPGAKDQPSVYFEIAENLDPVAYDPSKLKPAKDEETLKIVVEHARLLVADKKIKP